jgi:hypothetical protein
MTAKLNQSDRQSILHLKDVHSDVRLKQGFALRLIANLKHWLGRSISQWPVAVIAVHLLLTVVWIAALIWLSVSLITASVHA